MMALLVRLLAVFGLCTALLSAPAMAQVPISTSSGTSETMPELPDPLTPDAINAMVAQMSDDQVRTLLLDRLDAVAQQQAQAAAAEPSGFVKLQTIGTKLVASWVDAFKKLPMVFVSEAKAISNFASQFGGPGLLSLFGFTFLALALGFAAERGATYLTRQWQKEPTGGHDDLWGAARFLFWRFCRELLGLVVFYIVLITIGRRLLDVDQLAYAGPFVFYLIWVPRLGAALSRFVLAPNREDLRLVNVNDKWAKYLYRNLIGLFLLIGFTLFIVKFNALSGVSMSESRIGFWLNTSIHIYIAIIAWTAREGLSDMMRGTDPDRTDFDEWIARGYPYFAVGVAVVVWFIVEIISAVRDPQVLRLLGAGAHFTTMFWLLMAPAIDTLIRGLVRHLQPPIIGEGLVAEAAYRSTKRSYINIGRVFAIGIVVILIANAWNFDLRNLAAAGVGDRFASNVIEFIWLAAIGFIVYEVIGLYMNRRLAREQTSITQSDDQAAGEGGGAGGSRLATVLPLLRITAQTAVVVIFGLLAIGSLGVDITPLLAGAGILGLAIGFGAQKLVTDVVSGIFFLVDDAFRVGEYVEVDGGTAGSVEKISIRSMQLRHHRGPVHTIPYGEIPKLTNYSRDWVIMKLKFTVPFDTDPNKIKKIFKKIGAEMQSDPLYKDDFLEPFKSQGVFDFDDVGMVIRGKFMAKPGTQFTIRKEIYNRVKSEFNAAGIDFARREVRVAMPDMDDEHPNDAEKAALAAAAAGAVQAEIQKNQES